MTTTTTVYLARPPTVAPSGVGEGELVVVVLALAGGAALLYYTLTVQQAQAKVEPKADAKINPATQWVSTSPSIQQPVYQDTKTAAPLPASVPTVQVAGAYDRSVNLVGTSAYFKSGKTEIGIQGPSISGKAAGNPLDVISTIPKLFKNIFK